MKAKPRELTWLAVLLAAIAAALPVQIMLIHEQSPLDLLAIAAKLAPLNWLLLATATPAALAALRASRASLLLLPVVTAVVIWNNWVVATQSAEFSPVVAYLSTAGFIGCVGWLLSPTALRAILNPSKRWWRTPLRYSARFPVRLAYPQGPVRELLASTFDLSESGAFIASPIVPAWARPGREFNMHILVPGLSKLDLRAEVVRISWPRGGYPAGLGVRFIGLSRDEKAELVRASQARLSECAPPPPAA